MIFDRSTKTELEKIVNDENYYNRKSRSVSLEKWGKLKKLQESYEEDEDLKDDLAAGGFYYNEKDDTIRCFCCDMSIELKEGENPTAKHWIQNPECNFLKSSRYNGPKVMEYLDLKKRIQSFGLWPTAMVQRPREMAEAGFLYTGAGDKVQCFFCFGKFSRWEENDDPWEEHAYWIPTCQYIIIKKGNEYVKKVNSEGRKGNGRRRRDVNQTKVKINNDEKMETEEIDNPDKCAICYDKKRTVCFSPCHHYASCGVCSFNTNSCPVCRSSIFSRITAFVH